jgi:hypothetical protein
MESPTKSCFIDGEGCAVVQLSSSSCLAAHVNEHGEVTVHYRPSNREALITLDGSEWAWLSSQVSARLEEARA